MTATTARPGAPTGVPTHPGWHGRVLLATDRRDAAIVIGGLAASACAAVAGWLAYGPAGLVGAGSFTGAAFLTLDYARGGPRDLGAGRVVSDYGTSEVPDESQRRTAGEPRVVEPDPDGVYVITEEPPAARAA